MKRPAVFFDRDNTLIVSDGYLGDPAQVILVEGAAEIVARVRSLGYAVVVFSNQSGVARGLFGEDDVRRVNARLDELLTDHNPQAIIDRHEFCPFHPEGTIVEFARDSELRKPRPGMILQAAEKLALDLPKSWVIGDAPRDIESGKAAGCRTIWYKDARLPPSSSARELMLTVPDAVVSTLREAMDVIAREALMRQASAPEVVKRTAAGEGEEMEDNGMAIAPSPVESRPIFEPRVTSTGPRSVATAKPMMQVLAQRRAAAAAAERASTLETAAPAPGTSTARMEELAEQILQELQRRPESHEHDFSLSKLLAGIIQIVAIAVPMLAYLLYHSGANTALELGIFLQAFTIALLIMGKQR